MNAATEGRRAALDPPRDAQGGAVITRAYLRRLCEALGQYSTPRLNDALCLSAKGFRRIEALEEYCGVKSLYLDGNCLSRIENLHALTQLRGLFLQSNLLECIEGLEQLELLDTLNLAGNRIRCVEGLAALRQLTNLNLSGNQLSALDDLVGLLDCPALLTLDLGQNRLAVDEMELLDFLARLPRLRVLYLRQNPLGITQLRKKLIARLPQLTYFDDRPVGPEERRLAEAWGRGGVEAEAAERQALLAEKSAAHTRYLAEISACRARAGSLQVFKAAVSADFEAFKAAPVFEAEDDAQARAFKQRRAESQIAAMEMQLQLIDEQLTRLHAEEAGAPSPALQQSEEGEQPPVVEETPTLSSAAEEPFSSTRCSTPRSAATASVSPPRTSALDDIAANTELLQSALLGCRFDFSKAAAAIAREGYPASEKQLRQLWTRMERARTTTATLEELD